MEDRDMEKRFDKIEHMLVEIKTDMKHHIEKTDELEEKVLPAYKLVIFGSYFIKGLVVLSVVVGIVAKLI